MENGDMDLRIPEKRDAPSRYFFLCVIALIDLFLYNSS